MSLPSMQARWSEGGYLKPKIQILEVRDRLTPKGSPIARLMVEREEHYRFDNGKMYEASICLSYRQLMPKHRQGGGQGHFDAGYSGFLNEVSLTSSSGSGAGAIFLDLPGLEGHRIGTYLMNELVSWAKQWPTATVCSIRLDSGQATSENKARRNRFYEQFGLEFDYTDAEHKAGRSRPMLVGQLTTVTAWQENIAEKYLPDYIAELLSSNEMGVLELEQRKRAVEGLLAEIRQHEAKPLRWALRRTVYSWLGYAPIVLLFTVLGWAAWSYFSS